MQWEKVVLVVGDVGRVKCGGSGHTWLNIEKQGKRSNIREPKKGTKICSQDSMWHFKSRDLLSRLISRKIP